jgi:hypothetical protein
MYPENKTMRQMIKKIEVASGSFYRKIGGWFEWN